MAREPLTRRPPRRRPRIPLGHFSDGVRLAVGTLTVVPTPPPVKVNPRVAGVAMLLAPFVGLLLGLPVGAFTAVAHGEVSGLLVGVGVVGAMAALTRCMHLDGLADTADGLGSGLEASRALEIMRKGDVGPMGVVTLVLVLAAQVAAVDSIVRATPLAWAWVTAAVVIGRIPLPLLCSRGVPAARREGLGAGVAQSAPPPAAIAVSLAALGFLGFGAAVVGASVPVLLMAAAFSGLVTTLVCARAVARLGGVTGDVLGAGVEVATTAFLIAVAVATS